MTDSNDSSDNPAGTTHSRCTELGMRDTLVNLEEFALMMSQRCSIRALEILEVVPPGREKTPVQHPQSQPAAVIVHPAAHKKSE